MSNSGNDNVVSIEEAAMKAKKNTESFWEKHGEKFMLAGGVIISLLLNRKIDRLENKTHSAFKKVENAFNKQADFIDSNFDAMYSNFKIVRADISNVATSVGFQGKLGVNNISED